MFPKPITRRAALRLASAPIAALGLSQLARAANAAASFTFITVNDLHFFDEKCVVFFRNVVAKMRESAPDAAFCLLAGDLVDGGKAEQFTPLREIFQGLGVPLHAVPGNHDFLTDTDRTAYDAAFPDQVNYVFRHAGWQFIGLDTTQGTEFDKTRISDATLAWLDATLPELEAAAPTVAFTHFPLGKGVKYRPLNAEALLARLTTLNLRATFSGHWHGQNEQRVARTELIVNRCCARVRGNHDGSALKGWWVCQAAADGALTHRFAALPAEKGATP